MAKFRIDHIADLARQLAFSPSDTRLGQITAAEELLHLLDPHQAYPLEFIVFKITDYHPRPAPDSPDSNGEAKTLLTGLALQHDLGLLIEQISDSLDVRTVDLAEPVLSIDDVTSKFNVTSKTIQRWRRRGLPARRFLFGDGKRRVGFLLSSVERFFSAHRDQVERGTQFSQVSPAERQTILDKARRLAVHCRCCVKEIARRIARKLGRSPLTVEHTIRKHDQENPGAAIFPQAPPAIAEEERGAILKAYRRGIAVKVLARRACRPRAAVARVVIEEKASRFNRKRVRFIDDPLYHEEGAAGAIAAMASQEELPADPGRGAGGRDAAAARDRAAERAMRDRLPRDLPPYLAELYRIPLLTPARERALFLKYNYEKFLFVQSRRQLDPQFAKNRDLHLLDGLWRRATETKNQIVRANLRLVVSIARKHLRPTDGAVSLMDLVSEGNLTLMRAVESFDVHKGHRFSTYATLALMKGFARSVPLMRSGTLSGGVSGLSPRRLREVGFSRSPADARQMADLADGRHASAQERLVERDEVQSLLARLDERERRVLLAHYGLEGPDESLPRETSRAESSRAEGLSAADMARRAEAAGSERTYEQVARRLGLSKQRVRQIEQSALAKLRALAAQPSFS